MIIATVSYGCADSSSLRHGLTVQLMHPRSLGTLATKLQIEPRTAQLRHLSYVFAALQECKPWSRRLFIVKVNADGSGAAEGNPEKC